MKNRNKLIVLYAVTSVFVQASALAEQPAPEKNQPEKPQLVTLYGENEKIPDGDLITLNRRIGNWYLECSVSASKHRRVCYTEQYIYKGDDWIRWSLNVTKDAKTFVSVNAPTDIVVEDGIKMSFSGLEKTLDNITCNGGACSATFPLEGLVQSAIMSSKTISFTYKKKNNVTTTLQNDMTGLLYAIDVAGNNPLASINDDKSSDTKQLDDKKNKSKKNNK